MEDMRRHEVRELARLTARLDAAQQTFFQAEYGRHRRNPTTALLLCLLLGAFGAHYLYFGRVRAGLLRLAFCWTLVPLVMALFEAPTMEARAYRYNASLTNELLLAMKGAVEAESGQFTSLMEADHTTAVAGVAQPSSIAAPPVGAEAALIAAAWAGREPASDDPSDPPLTLDELAPLALAGTSAATMAVSLRDGAHAPIEPASADTFTWEPAVAESAPRPGYDATASEILSERGSWQARPAADPDPSEGVDSSEYAEPAAAEASEVTGSADDVAPVAPPVWDESPGEGWYYPPATSETTPRLPEWLRDDTSQPPVGPVAEDQRFQWSLTDGHPAVAEAAASAAAAWAAEPAPIQEPPRSPAPPPLVPLYGSDDAAGAADLPAWIYGREESAPAASEAAVDEREPVFMYQVAPAPRRESVRYGPPALDDLLVDTGDAASPSSGGAADAHPSAGVRAGEEAGLAALGSVLAAGLADLLKDRSARPRTVKLTTPLADDEVAPHQFVVPAEPLPATPPQAHRQDEPMADAIWAPAAPPAPVEAVPDATEPAWATYDAPAAFDAPLVATGPLAESASDVADTPAAFAADTAMGEAVPAFAPAAYASPISRNQRRRLVQRVIVRKMAMLDGQVVAESSVERQVPVVSDDVEMDQRINAATLDAAREALGNLMRLAPEEAVPAIRMQLHALDNPIAAQRTH